VGGEIPIDVLIVGAGPTGLTLAAQLRSFGVPFRIVDRNPTAAHESRALAVQARTLEISSSLFPRPRPRICSAGTWSTPAQRSSAGSSW